PGLRKGRGGRPPAAPGCSGRSRREASWASPSALRCGTRRRSRPGTEGSERTPRDSSARTPTRAAPTRPLTSCTTRSPGGSWTPPTAESDTPTASRAGSPPAPRLRRGLATEIGDGTTMFGFSFEDLLMDALGAGTSMVLSRSGWDDTFGFRYGSGVPQESACCANDTYGREYSGEIYTADFKIAGLGRR